MDARHVARALVDELFPGALAAFLSVDSGDQHGGDQHGGASVVPPELLVLLSGEPAPFRQSLMRERWSVELIGHTPASLSSGFAAEALRGQAELLRMCATGTVLTDTVGIAAQVQADAIRRLENGPGPRDTMELEGRCRELAGLLAELRHATAGPDIAFLACLVLDRVAELYLATEPRWAMSGESAHLRLARTEPQLHEQLALAVRQAVAQGRPETLLRAGEGVLAMAGGVAYTVTEPRPVPGFAGGPGAQAGGPGGPPPPAPSPRAGVDRARPRRSSAGRNP